MIEYSFKNVVVKVMFTLTAFRDIAVLTLVSIRPFTAGYREQKGWIFSEKPNKISAFIVIPCKVIVLKG